ncbi:nitroreductase [Clostridioides difficile]|nr:nitroreductase [Clostridioides difficile]
MTIYEAMINRHSVRNYQDKKIENDKIQTLTEEINLCNKEGSLAIQLITDDKNAFKGLMAYYGGFRNVSNYIALVGPTGYKLDEKLGYYGERIALKAQQLGLNTCWVAATYKKRKCKAIIKDNQALVCVLAIGYGVTQGVAHKSKSMSQVCNVSKDMPTWFEKGMESVLLAPTAMNKQNFMITLESEKPRFEVEESKYSNIDLGIIKYHFELGANITLGK